MTIRRNSVVCLGCNTEIESVHAHDMKFCPCGAVAVDGGKSYLRRVFTTGTDFRDTSICDPHQRNPYMPESTTCADCGAEIGASDGG